MQDSTSKNLLRDSKVIAIVGLSPNPDKPSFKVAQFLQSKGYKILPIYPKGGEILGEIAYATLQAAFESQSKAGVKIDILNIFRKSEALPQIAEEILQLKNPPKCVWVQLGLTSAQAKQTIRKADIIYVEDLCIKLEYERLLNDSTL